MKVLATTTYGFTPLKTGLLVSSKALSFCYSLSLWYGGWFIIEYHIWQWQVFLGFVLVGVGLVLRDWLIYESQWKD